MITEKRLQKFDTVAARRQQMTVILENVHDPHNIGAIMRTCDAVGIQEIFILYTEDRLTEEQLDKVKSSATGVRKWLHIHFYRDVKACFEAVKKKYDNIWATHLGDKSISLYEVNLTENVALLFGNEHEGITQDALSYADGNFLIPQYGMVGSLNISVACAVSLFEAARQRNAKDMYSSKLDPNDENRTAVSAHFKEIHNSRYFL